MISRFDLIFENRCTFAKPTAYFRVSFSSVRVVDSVIFNVSSAVENEKNFFKSRLYF
ncbi:hypothetical protein LEP1GSC038_0953 [Leptospira weilii str. 2006001855]|uniref:Uncharacterized protein n=1 Tax=Leptospira weilii str. 2006001855 TaxID=996804 RepID=M6FY22_9LEPT|nr:hypothetical protein LEP1GSC038_0953 [Leptospira weilii str. 2006001855]EMN46603.1 hypothetical protein LEP1GSC086_4044 [Leptospira weilii str. LNT 1234]